MHNGMHNGTKGQESMSGDILQSYLLGHNFTKNNTDVRPPAIGEEHEVISVDGRSSHSSVSGKSEVSNATPRRTDMDLGYEPEGSASPQPAHERWKLSLYNMLDDNEGVQAFRAFLVDSKQESVLDCWLAMKGFRNFDKINHTSGNSSASSSTTGSLSNKPPQAVLELRMKLAKKIYKTYMTGSAPKYISTIVKHATKQYILLQIKTAISSNNGSDLDPDLFLQAQNEIEHNVESNSYKKFLASNDFLKLATQCDSSSPKVSSTVTPQSNLSQSPRNATESSATAETAVEQNYTQSPTGASLPYLPRLDEHQIWNPSTDTRQRPGLHAQPSSGIRLTSDSLAKTAIHRSMSNNKASFERDSMGLSKPADETSAAYPYFTPSAYRVPPASAIGSDQASKSSDATSDTLSFTDNSSVDGIATYSAGRSGQKRMMRNQVKKNPANALPECKEHVQRTSRMKDIPNLATKNPAAFFEQLRVRLLRVLEEQKMRHKKFLANRARLAEPPASSATSGSTIRGDDEDMEQMLENHLARVMHSPGGHHSPPVPNVRRPRQPPPAQDAFYGQQKPNYPKVGVGLVPGMPQNEVPDVPTPVNPVDKNQMINAWIQMPQSQGHPVHMKNRKSQKGRRFTAPTVETVPEDDVPFVHAAGTTGLQSNASNRKLQPLAQDPTMPPFDQPDAGTTIEEVKRRLMEETDKSYDIIPSDIIPSLESLKVGGPPLSTLPLASHLPYTTTAPDSTSLYQPQVPPANILSELPSNAARESCSDTDSSTETATFSNMNSSGSTQQKSSSSALSSTSETMTTVVYYMPHEPVAYKVHIPHSPLTLGQFKTYLSKKGNFKYFFKQQSAELQRPVYFEVSKDNEELPLWEGIVLAKIDPCPA